MNSYSQANQRITSISSITRSSSTTTRARTREDDQAAIRRMIGEAYQETFDRKMPRAVWDEMERFLELGLQPSVIMCALDETTFAPRPAWAYTRAICIRLLGEGVHSMEEWEHRQTEWRRTHAQFDDLPF